MCTLSAQRACCVCLRYARLRFPCSRCVHLLFVSCAVVRALAVHARAVRVRVVRVVCLCSAHLHHAELVDIADNTPLINPSSTPAT